MEIFTDGETFLAGVHHAPRTGRVQARDISGEYSTFLGIAVGFSTQGRRVAARRPLH